MRVPRFEPPMQSTELLDGSVRPLTDREFRLFQALIERDTGIQLIDSKQALLVSRLRKRLRELGLRSFDAYYHLVTEGDESERTHMIDCICTNETRFFREPRHFDLLHNQILPTWKRDAAAGKRAKRIRAWSAACSSGEEAYSLAMTLLEHFPARLGWDVSVLATDLSTRALDSARAGCYPAQKMSDIPHRFRHNLDKDPRHEGRVLVGPAPRGIVEFGRVNLNDRFYPVPKPLDLILCRNVLIYFAAETKERIVDQLVGLLRPDGCLFLGHAESLAGFSDRVRTIGVNAYAPAAPGE